MRSASEGALETVQIVFEFRLHGLHRGDASEDDAEVGFQGRPEGVDGGDVVGVIAMFVLDHCDYAKGGDDAGAGGVLVDPG